MIILTLAALLTVLPCMQSPPAGTTSTPAVPASATPAPQPQPVGPSTVVPPPFVPTAGAQPVAGGTKPGTMPPPYIAGASQFLVQPGQTWQHLIADVKPGDEIIFPAGFHVSQVIDGLQGTREKPIFIRSRDRIPAAVACDGDGWVFRRPKHVVVENIMFLSPRGAAVVIDGRDGELVPAQPWPAEFTLRSCTVNSARADAEQDAVRLRSVTNVRIDQVQVDGWNDAAVEINDSRRVLVRGLMMVPNKNMPQSVGIKVLGNSGLISVTGCSFNKTIRVGVQVGTPCPDGDANFAPAIDQMRIDRCIFDSVGTGVSIVNVRDLVLSRATLVNPTDAIYSIPPDAGTVNRVLIEKCLAFWLPGTLAKFSPHPERILAPNVTLGDNLWYSLELPTAWEVLGAPFGFQSAGQLTSLDPGIDTTTLRPRNGESLRFGAHSIAASQGKRLPDDPVDSEPAPAMPQRKP